MLFGMIGCVLLFLATICFFQLYGSAETGEEVSEAWRKSKFQLAVVLYVGALICIVTTTFIM